MIDRFYKKIFNNINSNKIFYKYNKTQYKYSDINKIYKCLLALLSFTKKKQKKKIFIISNKSFEFYATSISIILSGNIWVPISPKAPEELIKKNIISLRPSLVFFDKKNFTLQKNIIKFIKKNKINFEIIEELEKYKINKIKIKKITKINENDAAMIFFTSGSTGEGKAVSISHKNYITSLTSQIKELYQDQKDLIFADFHDSSFVIILNILLPCIYTRSIICPTIETIDILFPTAHIKRNKINTLITVPSYFNQIKNSLKKKIKLNNLLLCGEPFYLDLLKFIIKNKLSTNIYNCYGSTELSPWVFSHRCKIEDLKKFQEFGLVPIGKKFDFVKTKIIDEELYISGASVVKGYLNEKLNDEKFFKMSGELYFRTNDIIKVINGISIIKGRNDRIVKILGYRVDLTEIEMALKKITNFKNCFVFIQNISEYEKVICAAIENFSSKKEFIELNLKKTLPSYMLPKKIIFMNKFPLNKNFKIDRIKIMQSFN
jgi:D-alanine--poly(phosphoribitol) ligase subunit 1